MPYPKIVSKRLKFIGESGLALDRGESGPWMEASFLLRMCLWELAHDHDVVGPVSRDRGIRLASIHIFASRMGG